MAGFAAFLFGNYGIERFLVLQHTDHTDHRLRVIAAACQILRAQMICFQFVLAPVAGEQRTAKQVGEVMPGLGPEFRHKNGDDGNTDIGGLCRALLAYAVARGDVSDLVAQYRCHLGFRIQVGKNAARDVDIAAGQGEGIDFRGVEYGEVVMDIGAVAVFGDFLAHAVDVALQRWVGIDLVLLAHVGIGRASQRNLLLLGHHHEILFAADGIGRTSAQGQCCNDDQECDENTHDDGPEKKKAAEAAF